MSKVVFELHFSVNDATGDGIIIEYTEQGRKVYNNTLGVMTNSPPYDFHLTNIRNNIELSKFAHDPLKLGKLNSVLLVREVDFLGYPAILPHHRDLFVPPLWFTLQMK